MFAENLLDLKIKRVETLESALNKHIEARSLIMQTVRQCIEKFINEVVTKPHFNGTVPVFHWQGGTFIGERGADISKKPIPVGFGLNFHKVKNGEVTFANWQNGKKNGMGVKLLKNKVAFCGEWVAD